MLEPLRSPNCGEVSGQLRRSIDGVYSALPHLTDPTSWVFIDDVEAGTTDGHHHVRGLPPLPS